MELKYKTQLMIQRGKTIKLNFWDLGTDLLSIQEIKQYQEENFSSMKAYVEHYEDKLGFSYASAKRYMQLVREYKDRLTVSSLGLTKALLLVRVPDEYKEELIEKVESKEIKSREELQKTLIRFKAGEKPSYSKDPQEHIYKLIREFDQKILPLKKGIEVSISRWLEEASKYTDLELEKRKEIAKEMI